MPIPKFDETFLPILKVLDKQRLAISSADLPRLILEDGYFLLTAEELAQRTASGGLVFRDRVSWGKAYLKQAKLVSQPSRAMVEITAKGRSWLASGKTALTLADLRQDPDYLAYVPQNSSPSKKNVQNLLNEYSPQELVETGFNELSTSLKSELREKLFGIDPYYFQTVILVLFQKMGYGDFEETPKSGDGGIDGIINQDQLGLGRIYIQAKRYKEGNKVREPDIRNFIGAMSGDVSRGIFVTTSEFDVLATKKASEDRNHTLILIDGDKLADLMIKYSVGVQTKSTYEVKVIDEDFFEAG
jgi:restriction system protein